MPELPEVETTRRGIAPSIEGAIVSEVILRKRRLRYPVPQSLMSGLPGQRILAVERRGKYLLLRTEIGAVLLHLGMSGSLRIVDPDLAPDKHDHVDIVFEGQRCLRFHDPRRFGAVLWVDNNAPEQHPLLAKLGPEPLTDAFGGELLHQRSRRRTQAVKLFIMDSQVVVGVGNIYASEALFRAGIRPQTPANKVSQRRYELLAEAIKQVLAEAIEQGGTTLRDFVGGDGRPGYFAQSLKVYGREGEPCVSCAATIRMLRMGQRSTYYCSDCQR
jgi:formamidopyrimidine-DNA glycosylase